MYRYEITKDGQTYYQDGADDAAAFLDMSPCVLEYKIVGEGEIDWEGYHIVKRLIYKGSKKPEKKRDKFYDYVKEHLLIYGNTVIGYQHHNDLERVLGKLKTEGMIVKVREVDKNDYDRMSNRKKNRDRYYILER